MEYKIKNIEEASERFKKAVNNKEKIVLYGDSDLDGIASVVILKETLEIIGADTPFIYFPNRFEEGHGLNLEALEFLKKELSNKFLLVLLDSGITSFKEIKKARENQIEVIIIDHHQPLGKVPEASLIVNPKQEGDNYFFKNLANVGVTFKLSEEILKEKMTEAVRNNFLELTALATISDMMEQAYDNKFFIEKGIESLEKTKRKGLIFLKEKIKSNSIKETSQRIINLLNVGDIIDHKAEGYNLLISQDEKEIKKIAEGLIVKSEEKKNKVNKIIDEIEEKEQYSNNFIFEYNSNWETSLLGTVASRLCQKTGKTIFLLGKGNKTIRGAVRASDGVNSVDVMSKYSNLLESFGGHPPAAGFKIKKENIEEFKNNLKDYFQKK